MFEGEGNEYGPYPPPSKSSSALEKTDCTAFAADFAKYAKGSALYKKKSRK